MQAAGRSYYPNRSLHDFQAWVRATHEVEVTVSPHFQFILQAEVLIRKYGGRELPFVVRKEWIMGVFPT